MKTTLTPPASGNTDAQALAIWAKTMVDGFTNLDVWSASRATQQSLFQVAAIGGDDESGDIVVTYLATAGTDVEARGIVQALLHPSFDVSSCQFLAKCDRQVLQLVAREED